MNLVVGSRIRRASWGDNVYYRVDPGSGYCTLVVAGIESEAGEEFPLFEALADDWEFVEKDQDIISPKGKLVEAIALLKAACDSL